MSPVRSHHRRRLTAVPLGLLAVALGCGAPSPSAVSTTTAAPTTPGAAPLASTASTPTSTVTAPSTGIVAVAGTGWDPAGLHGPVPAAGACHVRQAADGRPLPDPACTPGAVDMTVTQSDLASTICRPGGYTSSVRPPEGTTEPFKRTDLAAYGEPGPLGSYELDHLVPLELGGASDTRNLWPEPDDPASGAANSKDPVESALHDLVCAAVRGGPSIPLATAQRLIASDWTTALATARAMVR